MNNNNHLLADDDDELSSTTGSDFEPEDVQQQQQEYVREPLNDENAQPTLAVSQQQRLRVAEKNNIALNARVNWLEKQLLMEKLKVAVCKKEKAEAESAGLKARLEVMEQQKQQLEVDKRKQEGDGQMLHILDKKITALGIKLDKMLMQRQDVKENIMEKNIIGKLIQAEFCTFKQDIKKQLEQEGAAKNWKNFMNEWLLNEWLIAGVGLLRNVSFVRIDSNELITARGWTIQGRFKAKKYDRNFSAIRAAISFPVAGACPNVQLLFYFEVTVITARSSSYMYIGLCGANFPFSTTSQHVGGVAGSFAIRRTGEYWASGTGVSGHGEGEFASGDVVGSGLMILPEERRIFFTKNGEIWGKPILLGPEDAKSNLFPIVSSDETNDEVQFNFTGPFRYPLAHLNVADG